jgi:pimeloyl-ACP methyl ester carboxylesterase
VFPNDAGEPSLPSVSDGTPYDEMGLFHENAAEYGIPWTGPPAVRRTDVEVGDGRHVSALVWGRITPDLLLLHGGAQNAHTWDTVALALARPLVAVDLPGHGHSGPPAAGALSAAAHAEDVAVALRALATTPAHVVGMSLGGLTALALADAHPELVRTLTLVDVTPGASGKAGHIAAFIDGPERFADFDELLARTVEFNPTRSVSSLRRGILHNAQQLPDGSWVWRHARFRVAERDAPRPDFSRLWDAVDRVRVPLMLARGLRAQSVVDDADEAELRRRAPHAEVRHFAESGHSIQGDQPVELARAIAAFTDADRPS